MADIMVEVRQFDKSATSEGMARRHRVLMDRPEEKGGLDKGPMGGELFLLSLGGCFMSNLIAAAKARNVVLEDLAVTVEGTLASAPARFESIAMVVHGTAPDEAIMDKLVEIAERGCIVHNTLKAALPLSVQRAVGRAAP